MKQLFTPERRPCMVDTYEKVDGKKKEKRAFFHLFTTNAYPIEPSPLKGGHPGGQVTKPVAIVEYEDGTVEAVLPSRVRFLDTKELMEKYAWCEKREQGCPFCKHSNKSFKEEPCNRCIDFDKWEEKTQ